MSSIKSISRITIATILVTSLHITPAFAAGRTNQSVANTVLNGRGAPTSKIGINGDFYIDTLTMNFYGPKTKNRWSAPVSLRGPAGSDGKDGDKGATSSGVDGARGPKGETGAQGLKGDKGEKGDKGDIGEKGAQGLIGLTGATGPAGAKGETGLAGAVGAAGLKGDKGDAGTSGLIGATGPAGSKGDAGTAGTNGTNGTNGLPGAKGDKGDPGDAGAKGDQGIQGIQGIQGSTGPSNVRVGNISFSSALQGQSGVGQDSIPFGNFEAGKSYIVDVLVWGISSSNAHSLKLSVTSSNNAVQPISHWFTAVGGTYRNNSVASEYSFMGRIALDGSSANSSFNLILKVTTGEAIFPAESVTLSGGFSGQLVGTVTNV